MAAVVGTVTAIGRGTLPLLRPDSKLDGCAELKWQPIAPDRRQAFPG